MIRLFTAIEVPDEVAACLTPLQRGVPGARWVTRENLHVTLRFIGGADERMAEEVDHASFTEALYTAGTPDPDLLIRTSGEQRISNFLLWQCAYAELVFTDRLWPDFGVDDFLQAIEEFRRRERRYGASSG